MRTRIPGAVDIKADQSVAWRVHRNAGSVTGPAMILHNVISLDTHSCYNSATGYYTVKVPGLYFISASEYSLNNATAGLIYFDIRVNDVVIGRPVSKKDGTADGVTAEGNFVAALNAGDTISVYLVNFSTYGLNVMHSCFTGFRIGP